MVQCEKNNEYYLKYYNENVEEIESFDWLKSNRILFDCLYDIYIVEYDLKHSNCDIITKIN